MSPGIAKQNCFLCLGTCTCSEELEKKIRKESSCFDKCKIQLDRCMKKTNNGKDICSKLLLYEFQDCNEKIKNNKDIYDFYDL